MTTVQPKIHLPKMNAIQFRAIERFAEINGGKWKANLRGAWMRCNYRDYGADELSAPLQQLRNAENFGPSGLIKFRLPDGEDACVAVWRRLVISGFTSAERQQIEATRILLDTTDDEIEFNGNHKQNVYIIPSVLNDPFGEYVEFQVSDGKPGIRSETLDFLSLREALAAYKSICEIGWKAHNAKEYPQPASAP